MARLTWIDETGVNPENLNKMTQDEDFKPAILAFNGDSGRTITHNYGHKDYQLIVNPAAGSQGFIGDVWITKSSNTAVVYNSGSGRGNFAYVIMPHA